MQQFQPGQRVIFQDVPHPKHPNAPHFASWGEDGRVMLLNAQDENGNILPITGTIVRLTYVDDNGNESYSFIPDGWPQGTNFFGCQIAARYLSPLDDGRVLPGTITDRMGRKI